MRVLSVILAVFLLAITTQAKYSGGSGTVDDPYQIATAADLIAFGETPDDYDKHFLLTADIDLDPNLPGRKVFDKAVIAPDTDPTEDNPQGALFAGVFDGNGHTISNLRIAGKDYVGLFGRLADRAEVRDLGMVDINITASGKGVGGLVGSIYESRVGSGHLIRCYSTGAVSGGSSVGGLVGSNGGTVTRCYSTGVVNGSDCVGGLVGTNYGTVTNCYSTGAVSGTGSSVGGLVGETGLSIAIGVWDMETSGLSGSAGGVGLTTAEMMDADMLALNGFANDPNWVLDAGHDYPRLAWEDRPGQVIPEPLIDWLDGGGTAENPYRIDTLDQLILLGKASILWGRHFLLGADIDLDSRVPEGQVLGQAVICVLSGVFDGNGHTISHLTIQGASDLGLFGQLESGAEVKNLGIVDVNIAGSRDCAGGLVGTNYGTVTNCYSTGAVSGSWDSRCVGGLLGSNEDTVNQCYSTAAVSDSSHSGRVGGLVGWNTGTVTQCYCTGSVSGTGPYIGGLVGFNGFGGPGVVTQCYSTAMVNSTGQYSEVGGLLGYNQGNVTYCYSTGAVIGTGDCVGGLVGVNGWFIESARAIVGDCFWDIQASGQELSDAGMGEITVDMQTAQTFLDAGWDFVGETANGTEDIWWIDEGRDYPRLWWELSIEDHVVLVIDDFESYTEREGERIYETWIDGWTNGTGSSVYWWWINHAVHDGHESLSLDYNNINSPFYSEAEREFWPAQNWTANEAGELVLYVRGWTANAAAPLYVAVEDTAKRIGAVVHPDPAVVTVMEWIQWRIPLGAFTDAGVNMARVKKMYIGIGDKANPKKGGAGRIWIDDIGLTKRTP